MLLDSLAVKVCGIADLCSQLRKLWAHLVHMGLKCLCECLGIDILAQGVFNARMCCDKLSDALDATGSLLLISL